ncbi:MAG: sortase [Anaerolineales bacterium]|nr:sortase [Anaerolineales bacterium]
MKNRVLMICISIFFITLLGTPDIQAQAKTSMPFYGAVGQTSLSPNPENPGAGFGNSVAISGDTLVIGARYDSVSAGSGLQYQSGAAYVYIREGNAWVQQARLAPDVPQAGDLFGSAVDIDQDTIVVGAVGNDSVDENGNDAPEMGAVYVFTRSDDIWRQGAKIEPEDGIEADYFGNAVAIVRERIVVGASGKDIGTTKDAGKVYSYYRSGTKWYQSQSITAPKPEKRDNFGSSLDLDGPRLVVGAPAEDKVGAAYIYYRTGSTWTQESKIEPDDDKTGDFFGSSVAVNGGIVVVGVPFADPDLGAGQVTNAGAAYVFKKKANRWELDEKLVPDRALAFDNFGDSVTTNGNSIVVGATGQAQYGMQRAGTAYSFERRNGDWELQTQIASVEPYSESSFGSSVAIDGDWILVGEPGVSPKAGIIHIYSLEAGILPETGFAPGSAINSPQVNQDSHFLGSLQINIPKISLQTQIVGAPRQANSWHVAWLSDQVGHLEGTPYPTHLGNSVIAGHINVPDGSTGPFADIDQLAWSDRILIHLNGDVYVFEVREVYRTTPDDLDVLTREDGYSWITLVTCDTFDPISHKYTFRTIVVAVRVD